MKAIILAGGLGTRLRPIIGEDVPKCLAPVMGRPMVSMVINRLKMQGIKDITLALHYKAEKFVDHFGDKVKYKIEKEPLGTGGAIKNCIEGKEPVLVVNGDTICPINYNDLRASHIRDITIAVDKNTTSAGIYIIDPRIFAKFPQKAFSLEKDVIPRVAVSHYPIPWFTDYGTPEQYEKACKEWV